MCTVHNVIICYYTRNILSPLKPWTSKFLWKTCLCLSCKLPARRKQILAWLRKLPNLHNFCHDSLSATLFPTKLLILCKDGMEKITLLLFNTLFLIYFRLKHCLFSSQTRQRHWGVVKNASVNFPQHSFYDLIQWRNLAGSYFDK